MLHVTRDQKLTTAIAGSYPRPLWYDVNLNGRSFKSALGDSMFREQYDVPRAIHGPGRLIPGHVVDAKTGGTLPEFQPNSTAGGPGDKLHPNRAGYAAMANAVDLTTLGPKAAAKKTAAKP